MRFLLSLVLSVAFISVAYAEQPCAGGMCALFGHSGSPKPAATPSPSVVSTAAPSYGATQPRSRMRASARVRLGSRCHR